MLLRADWALVSHWHMCPVNDAYVLLCPAKKNTEKASESTNEAQESKLCGYLIQYMYILI